MKIFPLLCCALGINSSAMALEAPRFIQDMVGCFSVTYNFVEDGASDEFFAPVMEKTELKADDEVIHLTRALILGDLVQAHWREEWRQLELEDNIWEQTVYGPYGDFRYKCSGALVEGSWRCEALKAAKPRRDQEKPYAYLDRENTLKVNAKRWIHSQKNIKRKADGGVYAVELGWNQYEKQSEAMCLPTSKKSERGLTH